MAKKPSRGRFCAVIVTVNRGGGVCGVNRGTTAADEDKILLYSIANTTPPSFNYTLYYTHTSRVRAHCNHCNNSIGTLKRDIGSVNVSHGRLTEFRCPFSWSRRHKTRNRDYSEVGENL